MNVNFKISFRFGATPSRRVSKPSRNKQPLVRFRFGRSYQPNTSMIQALLTDSSSIPGAGSSVNARAADLAACTRPRDASSSDTIDDLERWKKRERHRGGRWGQGPSEAAGILIRHWQGRKTPVGGGTTSGRVAKLQLQQVYEAPSLIRRQTSHNGFSGGGIGRHGIPTIFGTPMLGCPRLIGGPPASHVRGDSRGQRWECCWGDVGHKTLRGLFELGRRRGRPVLVSRLSRKVCSPGADVRPLRQVQRKRPV